MLKRSQIKQCLNIGKLIINSFWKFAYGFLVYVKNIVIKFPARVVISVLSFIVLYLYSLQLMSYSELFKISSSFFVIDSIELKIWNSFFIFFKVLSADEIWKIILLTILMITFVLFPMYFFQVAYIEIKKDNTGASDNIAVIGYKIFRVLICLFLWLYALYCFLLLSGSITTELRNNYVSKNNYCQILKKITEKHLEILIVEEKSVPYQLLFTESGIIYFQPNQPIAMWKKFESEDISSLLAKHCINK